MRSTPLAEIEPFEVNVAGRAFFLTPSMELIQRLEAVVGPLLPWAARLEKGEVTFLESHAFYMALVRADDEAPTSDEIKRWLMERGRLRHRGVALFTFSLVAGTEAIQRERQRIQSALIASEIGAEGSA